MKNLRRLEHLRDGSLSVLRTEMDKLHAMKIEALQTGVPPPQTAEQTIIMETARKAFDKAYDQYLAAYKLLH